MRISKIVRLIICIVILIPLLFNYMAVIYWFRRCCHYEKHKCTPYCAPNDDIDGASDFVNNEEVDSTMNSEANDESEAPFEENTTI